MSKMNQEANKNSTSWVLWTIFILILLVIALIVTYITSVSGFMELGIATIIAMPTGVAIVSLCANREYGKSECEKTNFQKSMLKIGKIITFATLALSFWQIFLYVATHTMSDFGCGLVVAVLGVSFFQILYGIFSWIALRHSAYRNMFWCYLLMVVIYVATFSTMLSIVVAC